MKTLLAAIIFVGIAVLLLGVNIFFFHRPFPDGEVSSHPEMRKRGIKCVRQEEMERLAARKGRKVCCPDQSESCKTCALMK